MVDGRPRDYQESHPTTAALIVEVADSSLLFDRGRKLPLYARNGIPEVWIVNVVEGRLEVHRDPEGDVFRDQELLTAGDRVASVVLREPVMVADLLP